MAQHQPKGVYLWKFILERLHRLHRDRGQRSQYTDILSLFFPARNFCKHLQGLRLQVLHGWWLLPPATCLPAALRWGKLPIVNCQCSVNAVTSHKAFRSSMWNECCTNERQSRDPIRGTTNAGSMRTNCCALEGNMSANKR